MAAAQLSQRLVRIAGNENNTPHRLDATGSRYGNGCGRGAGDDARGRPRGWAGADAKRLLPNNLRRLGVALQTYHQAHGLLPPAAIRGDLGTAIVLDNRTSGGQNYTLRKTYANWIILLLPQMGEDRLAAAFDSSLPVTDGRTPRHARPRCPG